MTMENPSVVAINQQQEPYDGQIKTVTEERVNEKGQTIRVTRKIRMKLIRDTVDATVALRQHWKKYGKSEGDAAGPNLATTIVGEHVYLRLSTTADPGADYSGDKPAAASTTPAAQAKSVVCQYCQGAHWSSKCPMRASILAANQSAGPVGGSGTGASQGKDSKYVPPSMRGVDREAVLAARPESYAVRLNNLSDITTEFDLRQLCQPFGQVVRVYVAKDDRTGKCRGFGFVNFQEQSQAEKCVSRLNGYTYGNMILKAELSANR